jgi:hypothetical protein
MDIINQEESSPKETKKKKWHKPKIYSGKEFGYMGFNLTGPSDVPGDS